MSTAAAPSPTPRGCRRARRLCPCTTAQGCSRARTCPSGRARHARGGSRRAGVGMAKGFPIHKSPVLLYSLRLCTSGAVSGCAWSAPARGFPIHKSLVPLCFLRLCISGASKKCAGSTPRSASEQCGGAASPLLSHPPLRTTY